MSPAADPTRIVAYCWSNPALTTIYAHLARYLRDTHDIETVFVTDGPAGALLNLLEGFEAYTINALVEDTGGASLLMSMADRDVIEAFDKQIDRHGDPPPEVIAAAYDRIIRVKGARALLTWNGAHAIQSAGVHAARQHALPCYFLERGLLPNTLVVDPVGVNYGSHIAGDRWAGVEATAPDDSARAKLEAYCSQLCEQGVTIVQREDTADGAAIRERFGIPADAPIILFPLQIERDTNIIRYSPHFDSMPEAVRAVQGAAYLHPNVHLIVKPHPEDRDRLSELESICGPRTHLAMDYNVRSVIQEASVVVAINSTVGLEALTAYKPVITLGNAIYSQKGFTFDYDETVPLNETIGAALDAAKSDRFNKSEFFRFLNYLLRHCLFSFDEGDAWGSRAYIGQRIAEACAAADAVDEKDGLEEASSLNMELLSVFGQTGAEILLVGGNTSVADRIRELAPSVSITHVGTGHSATEIPKRVTKRYDAAVLIAQQGVARKGIWPIVRADRKIAVP